MKSIIIPQNFHRFFTASPSYATPSAKSSLDSESAWKVEYVKWSPFGPEPDFSARGYSLLVASIGVNFLFWDFQPIFPGPAQTWGVAQIVALEILYNSRELTMGSYQTQSGDIVDLLKSTLRNIFVDILHMSLEKDDKSSKKCAPGKNADNLGRRPQK